MCAHGGGKRGMNWEARHTDTHTPPCVKYKASIAAREKLLNSAGSSAQRPAVTEGWRNEGVHGEGGPGGKSYMYAHS